MKRAVLALATLAACSSPATGLRVGPTPTSTTTSAQQSEGVGAPGSPPDTGDRRPAPSGSTVVTDVVTNVVTTAPPATTEPPTSLVLTPTASTTVSWYGAESGARTANGDTYDPEGLTFAHRSMAFGSRVRFCRNGACVVAVATDRGPAAWTGRDFDLSQGTFAALAPLSAGVATVTWEQLG